MEEKTNFKFNVESILHILSNDIYDSPLSLIRENVQNAYDAILQRRYQESDFFNQGEIKITLSEKELSISDNGIGMTKDTLIKNYWTAGSSGKNTPEAKAAGVVGTFGIGAMANFGVSSKLDVCTRYFRGNITVHSSVNKEDLKSTNECISINTEGEKRQSPGTTVKVYLSPNYVITSQQIKEYLTPYIQYLTIPVYINDELVSTVKYELVNPQKDNIAYFSATHSRNNIQFDYRITLNKSNDVRPEIYIENIKWFGTPIDGNLFLTSKKQSLFGYRNSFGLAQVPVSSFFEYGGIVNLAILTPTAGRDAISRESINVVSQIFREAEYVSAICIANTDMADKSREFIRYIRINNLNHLGGNLTIHKCPYKGDDEFFKLKNLALTIDEKKVRYYIGNDESIINSFSGADNIVLKPSEDSNRRYIQLYFLTQARIPSISDNPQVTKKFKLEDIESAEYTIKLKIESVIKNDYLFQQCEVIYAVISHELPVLVKYENDELKIYLKRNSKELDYLSNIYSNEYSLLDPLIKDYVRTNLYTKISPYVPSSQRKGTDELYRMLLQRKEEWSVESYEVGNINSVWEAYLSGNAKIEDVAAVMSKVNNAHSQTVGANNIGSIQDVIGTQKLPTSEENARHTSELFEALPPIMRIDKSTKMKILRVDSDKEKINGYKSFLALSDSLKNHYIDFFMQPHSTKVIWSMHKIIYIFTHLSGKVTLYYDMELNTKLSDNLTGGKSIMTSTILTMNRIFVPIIPELEDYFDIKEGNRKFLVRFDDIRS